MKRRYAGTQHAPSRQGEGRAKIAGKAEPVPLQIVPADRTGNSVSLEANLAGPDRGCREIISRSSTIWLIPGRVSRIYNARAGR